MNALQRPYFAVLLGLPWLAGLVFALAWLVAGWLGQPAHDALVRARAVADLADAYRLHVTSKGGVFAPEDADAAIATKGLQTVVLAATKPGEVQQKLGVQDAFLALQDLARTIASAGAAASVRTVSDSPLNPASSVSETERASLRAMRDEGLSERWMVDAPVLRYTRALKADSSCLLCHGDPSAAPEAIRAHYVTGGGGGGVAQPAVPGFGYRVGTVVGMTSVVVDLAPLEAQQRSQGLTLVLQALGALLVTAIGWMATCALVCPPLMRRVVYAQRLAAGDPQGALEFAPKPERRVARELAQLDRSLEVLHESAFAAVELAKAASPN